MAEDLDDMPDGVDVDAGRLEQLLGTLVDQAAAARAHLSEIWDQHEATARFEGQPFPAEPMDELGMMLAGVLEEAEAAHRLVDEAMCAYWERHPDDEDDAAPENES